MRNWLRRLGKQLRHSAPFFLALLTGGLLWTELTASPDELALRISFFSGICLSWLGLGLLTSLLHCCRPAD